MTKTLLSYKVNARDSFVSIIVCMIYRAVLSF